MHFAGNREPYGGTPLGVEAAWCPNGIDAQLLTRLPRTALTIVAFVAAVIVAALFSGCTLNVYLTDQVVYGTVTQETREPNEKLSARTAAGVIDFHR